MGKKTKVPETVMSASALLALGAQHASEHQRLVQLKSSGNRMHDPVFKECEENVQRMELEMLKARNLDPLYTGAPDLFRACEELLFQTKEDGPGNLDVAQEAAAAALKKSRPS